MEVTSPGGVQLVIDCGTGVYELGKTLLAEAEGALEGAILISHTHWDHIQGFPFFAPLFVPGGQWEIYGPSGLGRSIRETLAGQMQHTYFPVTLEELGAGIHFHDLVEGEFDIGDIHITARYLNHPALTLGYRMEIAGRVIVYACDHEPYAAWEGGDDDLHELDRAHAEFLKGADLVVHDAQFTDAEYGANRKGWGHSPVGYVSRMGRLAGVKRMALSHHDPGRTDDALDEIVEGVRADLRAQGATMEVFAAADGQVVELESKEEAVAVRAKAQPGTAAAPEVHSFSILIGVTDPEVTRLLKEAVKGIHVRASFFEDESALLVRARTSPPGLILLEDSTGGGMDGLALCRGMRADDDARLQEVPIVLVGPEERVEEGREAGVTRWLVPPFSSQYAGVQMQAWLWRSVGKCERAELPDDEERRVATLHGMAILDTDPEERFDRITRVAAAVANVPIVLVSLVDTDRQWFKSCLGLDVRETPRDISFCAHVVSSRDSLIVPDTLLDDRFSDNPLVVTAPRIRFYAGFPVFHENGSCLGTLCLLDTRPRQFSPETLEILLDLAKLVEQELNAG